MESGMCRMLRSLVALPLLGLLLGAAEPAQAGDDRFAWGENIGWINARPAIGATGMRVFEDHAEGWMWSPSTGWISLSCANRSTCGIEEWGVGHDGSGNLSGFAWAENAGWISFSCANTASCAAAPYGVTVDPATGEVAGFAWSETSGWISFSCANTASCAAVDYGVRVSVPFLTTEIFADGFESGDTSAWSATVP